MKIKILNSQLGYNLAASDYDKKEAYLNSFEKEVVWDLLGDIEGKSVLEVGAGTGRITGKLLRKGAEVMALDVAEEMLHKLNDKFPISNFQDRLKMFVGEAESLPFEDESFDIVIAAFLIVHLKDLTRFFDEVYRVLKPGGKFLVTNINQKRPPEIKTKEGIIEIESYYHRPEKVRETLAELAFGIEAEKFVKEGEVWINQIILAEK